VFIADVRKARRELGWSPRVGVDLGLGKLHEWLARTPEALVRPPDPHRSPAPAPAR
jgi:hypothetical protein